MAEAFARAYGSDVLVPASAGLGPANRVAPDTIRAMLEKNLNITDHFPKSIRQFDRTQFDLIVNLSGYPIQGRAEPIVDWETPDPVCMDYKDHCAVRDLIERMVVHLVLQLRRERATSASR
jgi:arsenate reductase